ncbi:MULTISPECIES: peptide-methionine (S)-S-oxide reductase MsrA [Sphingobium]|uniref:Peptide methionine sulfoxide reductase MsrA n=1 Tax=Sphingobium cupriresistens LL01 TaxID=1420583 RepID=A0A0J7Y3A3_9SPHN|nr:MULTISPECIES: peptide-methionine (S)-S-oxide reductase MsrA [unclassified Sphingobium]KMS58172.1 methionine sulfoxide reductase A [Sphingobium cupriresistens LL01]MBJ7377368.1 peptide-methionine (S)-S-oxide reductase MsrA [Sphingobium sp.]WCP14918.1 Peptide methionine sulfoxide reductase MsrA [Sphingobium sp. AntQ-1]
MSRIFPVAAVLFAGSTLIAFTSPGDAAERAILAPAAAMIEPVVGHLETATFAGGCFWGVEGVFSHVKGVISATSGYAGGEAATADYESVSKGTTGHAESVRVVFDPTEVNYADLLRIYFSVVTDPTLLNRQGPDRGTQYRSALFPASPAQEKVARAYIAQLSTAHIYTRPIVTRVESNRRFFAAEAHHQDFMARNPTYPYIVLNDRPKVAALKRLFPARWKA